MRAIAKGLSWMLSWMCVCIHRGLQPPRYTRRKSQPHSAYDGLGTGISGKNNAAVSRHYCLKSTTFLIDFADSGECVQPDQRHKHRRPHHLPSCPADRVCGERVERPLQSEVTSSHPHRADCGNGHPYSIS